MFFLRHPKCLEFLPSDGSYFSLFSTNLVFPTICMVMQECMPLITGNWLFDRMEEATLIFQCFHYSVAIFFLVELSSKRVILLHWRLQQTLIIVGLFQGFSFVNNSLVLIIVLTNVDANKLWHVDIWTCGFSSWGKRTMVCFS